MTTRLADPATLDDAGRPSSDNPDAWALLKEAEDLLGSAPTTDSE